MVYKFDKSVVNERRLEDFYDKNNFVGYILPDGSIYKCKEHNIANVDTVFRLFMHIIKDNYGDKDRILNIEVTDRLIKLIIDYYRKSSYDEIVALDKFIDEKKLFISDILVQLFGCHLVTRLDKTILTSEFDHRYFYNYLLNDFTIRTIDKIIYDPNTHECKYTAFLDRNEYLYDEINNLKKEIKNDEIELFYKTR